MTAQRNFDRAKRFEEEGRLDEAVDAYAAAVRCAWREAAPYARLMDIHLHRREIDAAWCAASMLVVLEKLEDRAREFFEDYVPRRLPVALRLEAGDLALLRDPNEDLVTDALTRLRPALRVPPIEGTTAFDSSALRWAAEALGATEALASIARTDPELPPRAGLDTTHRMFTLRERLFFAGREAMAYFGPHFGLRRCSLHDLRSALDAQAPAEAENAVSRLHRAMTGTRSRAGVLVCGEPVIAFRLLTGEGADEEDLSDLAAFTVSTVHHRLRTKLGVAVGMSADV